MVGEDYELEIVVYELGQEVQNPRELGQTRQLESREEDITFFLVLEVLLPL